MYTYIYYTPGKIKFKIVLIKPYTKAFVRNSLLYAWYFSEMLPTWAYFPFLCRSRCMYSWWLSAREQNTKSSDDMIDRNASRASGFDAETKTHFLICKELRNELRNEHKLS